MLAAVILILATQVASFIRGDVTWRFFNAPELSSVSGNFAMLDGATRDDSLAMMREMQRATEGRGRPSGRGTRGPNPLVFVMGEVGRGNTGGGLSGVELTRMPTCWARSRIELIRRPTCAPYSSFSPSCRPAESEKKPTQRCASCRSPETVSFRGFRGGPGGDAIDVTRSSAPTPPRLKEAAISLQTQLGRFPEVSGLQDSMAYDREELSFVTHPQGEALGFEIGALGRCAAQPPRRDRGGDLSRRAAHGVDFRVELIGWRTDRRFPRPDAPARGFGAILCRWPIS